MSSLAAARADNFYYGPEYSKEQGSLNTYRKSHPLGARAKKIGQGILIVRFEIMFKVRCLGCDTIIAKGVRYNAEKKCVGNYFSTKIYSFSFKCYQCPNIMVIETDPKNAAYVLKEGVARKVEEFDAADAETLVFDDEDKKKRTENPMYDLEHKMVTREKTRKSKTELEELHELQEMRGDFYDLNKILRQRLKQKKETETETAKVSNKSNAKKILKAKLKASRKSAKF